MNIASKYNIDIDKLTIRNIDIINMINNNVSINHINDDYKLNRKINKIKTTKLKITLAIFLIYATI